MYLVTDVYMGETYPAATLSEVGIALDYIAPVDVLTDVQSDALAEVERELYLDGTFPIESTVLGVYIAKVEGLR